MEMHEVARPPRGLRFGRGDPFTRRSLGALFVLGVATAVYPVLPLADDAMMLYYQGIAIGAVVLAFLGVARHHPPRRRGWMLVLSGFSGWVVADLVSAVEEHVWHGEVYPVPSDAVYLVSYAFLAAGALHMVRTRRAGRDMTALLDATIIATGAAVVAGVFLVAPLASDSELTVFAKVISSAYPVGDLLLLAVIVRMWAAPGAQTWAYRLLVSAFAMTLVGDILWNAILTIEATGVARWADALWLGSYVAVGAAACVPSMTTLAEPAPDREGGFSAHRRLVVLACGIMLPAVTLLVDGATGGGVLWQVIGLGSILICGLVLLRMQGTLRTIEVQAVQLAALARSDALTGAPNRRTWDHELSRACATSREQGTSLCVAMMDIDHFKVYNDTHGHQAGDRLLREAVAGWTEQLGSGALLARYGGEEFAVLLPGVTLSEASASIQGLRPLTPHGQTFSAGVSLWDSRSEPANAVACADQALYEAKRSGRNRVLSYSDGSSGDGGAAPMPALNIVMQPIIDLATGRVVGREALARFDGPVDDVQAVFRGAHADGQGDLLEAAAIIAALEVPDRPQDQALYVSASAAALTSNRFWALMPPRLDGVVVGLTEDVAHIDTSNLLEAILRLRSRGARIALDDLGVGVGDFYRLAAVRPDVVKADRSLVHGCSGHSGQSAVLKALVAYATELGATVCAEGVEDTTDLERLRELGITLAQGHLLCPPGAGNVGSNAPGSARSGPSSSPDG